ncbi:general secretion pathway protein K [Thermotomaculum hydrothermale]|uniref:General secretion pathway protein K n=1 Tax=Thermotomaculum hydrothermale TaxID=981385 RepID=A0A7R6PY58_9BACT|nr:type II secretion system protein GspK [Thermotomaculum hydrothermale]BBB32975.1 general secretion pathway protein K [Thermotomaculum hydrothermale]
MDCSKKKNEKGAILIIVIWIVAAIAIISAILSLRVKVSVRNNAFVKMKTEGFITIHGAIQRALYYHLIKPRLKDLTEEEKRKTVYEYEVNGVKVKVKEIPVSSKLSLKNARPELLKQIFMNYVESEEDAVAIISSIQDWQDADNLENLHGAEDSYYTSLDYPYYTKNKPIENLKELLLIKGITPEMYYGTDNYPGLKNIFTLYDTGSKADINTCSPDMFKVFGIDQETIDRIIERRESEPFKSMTELNEILDSETINQITKYFTIDTRPSIISFKGEVKIGNLNYSLEEVYSFESTLPKLLEIREWNF